MHQLALNKVSTFVNISNLLLIVSFVNLSILLLQFKKKNHISKTDSDPYVCGWEQWRVKERGTFEYMIVRTWSHINFVRTRLREECRVYKTERTGPSLPNLTLSSITFHTKWSLEKFNSYKIANLRKCLIMMTQFSLNSTTHQGPVSWKHHEFNLSQLIQRERESVRVSTMCCLL